MKPLFITPFGGRTGSEMMLWYYLDFLKNTPHESIIYSKRNGELLGSSSPARFTYSYKRKKNFVTSVFEGIYNKIYNRIPEVSEVMAIHKTHQPDFWYINTIALGEMCEVADKLNVPYILHVHELPTVYEEMRFDQFQNTLKNALIIICCSSIVKQRVESMGYDNTILLHSFIDSSLINLTKNREELRLSLGIPEEAFVWGMSGSMALRKGYDMIPDIIENMNPDSYFVWLGKESSTGLWYYVQEVAKRKGLNFIHITAKSGDYYDYLNLFDGFALLSREDPFPLVMIEAAYLQKPLVSFESGGSSEFIQEGMGLVTEGVNIRELTDNMKKIERKEYPISKDTLRKRALEFDKEAQIGKWYKTMQGL
jgi:glycosyltransferase involved in cell wall biosynthesis